MEQRLPKDLITQPELWRCVLHITPSRLNVAVVPPVAQEEMVAASLLLNPEAPTPLKALEDAVYDNPLLLSDFKSVHCLVETPTHAVVPAPLATPDDAPLLLSRESGTEADPDRTVASPQFGGAAVVYELPEPLEAFLRRTFFGVTISTPIEEVGKAATQLSTTTAAPVMIAVADTASAVTLAAARGGELLMLNTFTVNHPADAAYYLLASRSTLGLGKGDGTVWFAGQAPLARTVANIVTPYLDSVEFVTIPPELCGYGREAGRLTYPLTQYLLKL